ncbi:hypothetical protein [Streptomyces prasinus]
MLFTVAAFDWRSPSEAAENRNFVRNLVVTLAEIWRLPSGATEDRNIEGATWSMAWLTTGGRPPGRPRIATLR